MTTYAEESSEQYEQTLTWARLYTEDSKLIDKHLHLLSYLYCLDNDIKFKTKHTTPLVSNQISYSQTDTALDLNTHFYITNNS